MLCINSIKKSTVHGISNLVTAKSHFERLSWLFFIVLAVIFCVIYIVNSFIDYFSYDVISNLRFRYTDDMNFPAVIFCGVSSEYPIHEGIFKCTFNNYNCQDLEKVIVLGSGLSEDSYCIRFNGKIKSSNKMIFKANKIGIFDYGLKISFLIPDEVKMNFFILSISSKNIFRLFFVRLC